MSSPIIASLADALVGAFESDKAQIEAFISTNETQIVDAAVAVLINSLPKNGLIAQLVNANVKAAIQSAASQLLSQYGADFVYGVLDAEAHALAKQLGG